MASTPSPPPAQLPLNRLQWRFEPITTPTEWIESYRPGNLHPVHFEDKFKDGQYRVIRKLGCGGFSTVWLAVDQKLHRYVALKIQGAGKYAKSTETSMLRHLTQEGFMHPGSRHITTLLDTFKHHGPNGTHICLVLELMGPSAAAMVRELECNKPVRYDTPPRYPLQMARVVLRQTLLALDFLHQQDITHGDLQPGNILFAVASLQDLPEDKLRGERAVSKPVKRLDGKHDKWTPQYLARNEPLAEYVPMGSDLTIKVSDMGDVFWSDKPPAKIVTPIGLRAPEIVLHGPITSAIDVWSFGCIVFEFITSSQLFPVPGSLEGNREQEDDDHLLMMIDSLGPLPHDLFSLWTRSKQYFGPNGARINMDGSDGMAADEGVLSMALPLDKYFNDEKPPGMDDEEISLVMSLLWQTLQYDPKNRPSASELLKHPWFSDTDAKTSSL